MIKNKLIVILAVLALLGLIDASYLTFQHYTGGTVACSITQGCEQVLGSKYAVVYGLPLSLLGAIYYATLFFVSVALIDSKKIVFLKLIKILSGGGVLFSIYLVVLQATVIHSYCMYCLISAGVTVLIFLTASIGLKNQSLFLR